MTVRTLTPEECGGWVEAQLDAASLPEALQAYRSRASYRIPTDTGRQTALARGIVAAIGSGTDGLFWITAWGIFPSAEHMELFDGYRESLGETRPLHAAPGHVFDGGDHEQLTSLVALALYFFWDAILVDDGGAIAVQISHDEWIRIHARDDERLRSFQDALAALELEPI